VNTRLRLQRHARAECGDFPVDLAWSPDGSSIVVAGGDGMVTLFDLRGGGPRELGTHAGGALAIAWQNGGNRVASAGQDGELRLWDARSGAVQCLHHDAEWTEQLAFSANGRLLAAATGRTLRIFDAAGKPLQVLPDHGGVITAIAWRPKSPANSLEIAAVGNGGARLHRLLPQSESRNYPWKGACLTAGWSPDGRVLASGLQDGTVHFWYIAAGTQSEMKGYGSKVMQTSWSANGRFLATSADEQIVVWSFGGRGPEGSEPLELRAHTSRVTQLQFQPQGPYLASGSRDYRLLLWQPGQSNDPVDADLLSEEIALLRWSNDGEQLAVGDRSGALTIYRLVRQSA
jgi:WD40 repeat protein